MCLMLYLEAFDDQLLQSGPDFSIEALDPKTFFFHEQFVHRVTN